MALFLFLETGMLGVFMALDLLIFFVFWEIGLVPMYFLINQWGSEKGEREIWKGVKVQARNYASLKFIIFTMGGSLGLLLAIQLLGVLFQNYDLPVLYPEVEFLDDRHAARPAGRDGQNGGLLGVCDRLCRQSSGLAVPYLAAGCPYGSPDRRFDDPGRCPAETGRVWFPAAGPAVVSGGIGPLCRLAGLPGGDGDCLRGICCLRPKRFQTAGGLFVGQPHGVCAAWELPRQPKPPARSMRPSP